MTQEERNRLIIERQSHIDRIAFHQREIDRITRQLAQRPSRQRARYFDGETVMERLDAVGATVLAKGHAGLGKRSKITRAKPRAKGE